MNKKMTPHIIAVGALVVFIVLGLACATANIPIISSTFQDTEVPWQEQALLFCYGDMDGASVMKFDGKGKALTRNIGQGRIGVIPSGTHTLEILIEGDGGSTTYNITYDFQPGGRYVVFGHKARATGLLGVIGKDSMKIVPLDEFRAEWEGASAIRASRTAEKNDADYKSLVLDKFEKAEAELAVSK